MLLCAYFREVKVKKVYFPLEAATPTVVPMEDDLKISTEIDLTCLKSQSDSVWRLSSEFCAWWSAEWTQPFNTFKFLGVQIWLRKLTTISPKRCLQETFGATQSSLALQAGLSAELNQVISRKRPKNSYTWLGATLHSWEEGLANLTLPLQKSWSLYIISNFWGILVLSFS